jgi:aminomethyltransferase
MEENSNLRFTPLLEQHKKLGASLAPFGGWLMPIQYGGILQEHHWTRQNAGLFDICHMGEFTVEADLSKSNFADLFTIDLKSIPQGACRYGFMLNTRGGIVDDLVIYKISDSRWMVVTNAATTDSDEAHMRQNLSGDLELKNISASLGKLDLQGPTAAKVLVALAGEGILKLGYYTFSYFNVLGEDIIISRTGYTGELGFELYMPNQRIVELWQKILEDERVKPVGLGARDTLRLEMGYNLYGQDINENISPLEAQAEHFISWDKDFIGKPALLEQRRKANYRKLTCFIAGSRRSPRHNYRILHKGKDIGEVTSGSFSPSLACGIGMGYIEGTLPVGEEIILAENAISITAKITDKPFYKNGSAKRKEINNAYTG